MKKNVVISILIALFVLAIGITVINNFFIENWIIPFIILVVICAFISAFSIFKSKYGITAKITSFVAFILIHVFIGWYILILITPWD